MDIGLIGQHLVNGMMQGMIYALVAVGFTLFFGVLDVIKFSHGDVLMAGTFSALAAFVGLQAIGVENAFVLLISITSFAALTMAGLGMLIGRFLILPLRGAPSLNILLITLMFGTALREAVRLFYPDGSNSKAFPALLPDSIFNIGSFSIRLDSIILFVVGAILIVGTYLLINKTKLGLAIRAVAQDEETARTMGINFGFIVFLTFALGSGIAAIAGVMNGLYYNEINFSMGLLLGAVGFSAAIIGGLGNLYGAILGGFLFAGLQTFAAAALPIPSSYKDVFAFGVVIILMIFRPTGIIAERAYERV